MGLPRKPTLKRYEPWTPEVVRQRIKVSEIISRLHKHLEGGCEMSSTQIKAAEILLRKAVPDLASTQHTGEVTHLYVMALPAANESTLEWQRSHALTLNPS